MEIKDRFEAKSNDPNQKWLDWVKANQSKNTARTYNSGVQYFLKHNQFQDLNELYELQLEAEKRGVTNPLDKYKVHDLVKATINHRINEDGVSGSHAKAIKAGVTKFLRLCGFQDFTVTLDYGIGKSNQKGGSDIIEPKDLRVVLDTATDLKKRALLLTLKDSGLRLGDVLALDYGDVKEVIDSQIEFYQLKRFTKKTGERAQTVIGHEALEAIRRVIRQRRTSGEELTDDSPLFTAYRFRGRGAKAKSTKDTLEERKAERAENLKFMSGKRFTRNGASNMISRMFDSAGYPTVTAHGLRKFHSTYLSLGEHRVSEPMLARMEGRNIGDSREAYKIYPGADLVEAYERNYHRIAISGEESPQMRNELDTLRAQMQELQEGYKTQQNQLTGAMAMLSTLSPEQQKAMIEKLKEVTG